MSKCITCIVCPNSCRIEVEENGGEMSFSGNLCKRGIDFAKNEMTNPLRSVTTTVRTVSPEFPFLPVKTNGEIPKPQIINLIKKLNTITVTQSLKCSDIVLEDFCGVSVVSCADMTLKY